MRSLYPAGRVQDAIIIKVLGSLGHGAAKPSYAVQAALLKWLVMIYDVLENKRLLSQFYALLFNLLDTVAVRYLVISRPPPPIAVGHLLTVPTTQ